MPAKRLHAGRVAQVQSENFQPLAPFLEIRLGRVTHRRVARETRGDDELRAAAQQLDAGLIADFHASAGEQRHAPAQVGQFAALAPVQFRAGRAKLVVEMVDLRVILLADVAILRLDGLVEIGIVRHFLLLESRAAERRWAW